MNKRIGLLAALALGVALAGPAFAHGGGRVHFGLYLGGPVGYPYYYPPAYYPSPYYYPPAVVVQPSSPPVYVERDDAAPESAPSTAYWYYCAESKTYYPYVKHCPGGWQRVAPQPQE
jgi:hypothetical protein